MEKHEEVSCVYTDFQLVDVMGNNIDYPPAVVYRKKSRSGDVFIDLLKGNYILTLTVCFRKADLPRFYYESAYSFDYLLFLCLASEKQFYYLNEKTGCYRINPKGMIQSQREYVGFCLSASKNILFH